MPLLMFGGIPEPSYHRVFHLDGLYVQVVLCSSGGAALQHFVVPLEPFSVPLVILAVVPGPRGPRQEVATLLLGDVRLWAVDRLHVLSERARVRVALCTPGDLANVRFLLMKRLRNFFDDTTEKFSFTFSCFFHLESSYYFLPDSIICFNVWHHRSCGKSEIQMPTSLECVRFWCLARSEALEKALLQPSCSHTYGFSPVCERRCVFRFSRRE